MIKRIFLGKHKVKFDFNEDLFFSIYRNDLFGKDLGNYLNAENKEIKEKATKNVGIHHLCGGCCEKTAGWSGMQPRSGGASCLSLVWHIIAASERSSAAASARAVGA